MRQLAAVSGESWYARDVSVAARFRRLPDDVHLSRQQRMRCGSCESEAPSPIPEVRHARHWKTVCRHPNMERTPLRFRRTGR